MWEGDRCHPLILTEAYLSGGVTLVLFAGKTTSSLPVIVSGPGVPPHVDGLGPYLELVLLVGSLVLFLRKLSLKICFDDLLAVKLSLLVVYFHIGGTMSSKLRKNMVKMI